MPERDYFHRRRKGNLALSGHPEVAHLLIMGKLPNREEIARFSNLLTEHQMLHEDMKHHFDGFPSTAHPMAILSSMINASSCFDPELMHGWEQNHFDMQAARLLSVPRL